MLTLHGTITSASISKTVYKVLIYMCTKFGAFFIKCTIHLVCRCTTGSLASLSSLKLLATPKIINHAHVGPGINFISATPLIYACARQFTMNLRTAILGKLAKKYVHHQPFAHAQYLYSEASYITTYALRMSNRGIARIMFCKSVA